METMFREYAGSIIRTLLLPVFALLAEKGYITADDSAQFALAVAAFVVAVGWGIWNKYGWKKTTIKAIKMDPPATEAKLSHVINNPD
jgi:hypothetical protein